MQRSRLGLTTGWSNYGPDRKILGYLCSSASDAGHRRD
jgi:hypothetical protein